MHAKCAQGAGVQFMGTNLASYRSDENESLWKELRTYYSHSDSIGGAVSPISRPARYRPPDIDNSTSAWRSPIEKQRSRQAFKAKYYTAIILCYNNGFPPLPTAARHIFSPSPRCSSSASRGATTTPLVYASTMLVDSRTTKTCSHGRSYQAQVAQVLVSCDH